MSTKTKKSSHLLGILYILTAAFGFSMMTFLVKESGDLPTMQKVFFRNIVATVIAAVTLLRTPEKFKVKKGSWGDLFTRSIFGYLGMLANFWAIDKLVLADSNILNKMSPFFAIIMSYFILKEKPNLVEKLTVVIAFIGAVFVIQPTSGVASLPAVVGLISGFCAGTAYTFVRKLGNKGERGPLIVFFFSAFTSLASLPFLFANHVHMSAFQWACLLGSGAAAAVGQFAITAAYTHAPAKEISVFDYSQVIFAAILGFLFFGEVPNWLSFVGYAVIIGTAVFRWYYNLHREEKKENE